MGTSFFPIFSSPSSFFSHTIERGTFRVYEEGLYRERLLQRFPRDRTLPKGFCLTVKFNLFPTKKEECGRWRHSSVAFEYKKGGSLTPSLFSTPFFFLSFSWESGGTKHFPSSSSSFLLLLLVSQGDRWRHPLRGKERPGGPTLLPPPTVPPPFSPEKEEKSSLLPSGEIVVPLFGGGRIPILKLISPPFLGSCAERPFSKKKGGGGGVTQPTHPRPLLLPLLFLLLEISRQPIY